MDASQMIELRMHRPFVSFQLKLRDGSSVQVDEPNVVAAPRNGFECAIVESDDRIRFIKYLDIVEVVMNPVNGATSGG